jgi:hypothetical protein
MDAVRSSEVTTPVQPFSRPQVEAVERDEQLEQAPAFTARGARTPNSRGLADWLDATTLLRVLLVLIVFTELTLLLIALVPLSIWTTYGFPNGPIPRGAYPLVAALFYVLPALTGALCRRWPAAIVLATLPAWLDLGAFAIAAASRIGPFYVAQQDHAVSSVGTLELFAALGALGWLVRVELRAVWPRQRDRYVE